MIFILRYVIIYGQKKRNSYRNVHPNRFCLFYSEGEYNVIRKTVSLIIAALLVLLTLVSCVGGEDESSQAAESSGQSTVSENSEQNEDSSGDGTEPFKYDTKKYFGTTIKILTVSSDRHLYGKLQFVPYEDDEVQASSAVDAAVRVRNDYIYENYGITIKTRTEMYPTDVIYNEIMGNVADYDLVCDSVDRMLNKVLEGLFISLDDYVDLDDPWWDKEAIDDLSLDGTKHFLMSGDFMITDVDNIYLTLFNKKMYNENTAITSKYGDIYKLVEDKKFTLDAFMEMCKAVSVPDEEGNWSFYATYGNLSHGYGTTIMVNGGGVSTVEKASEGGLRCAVLDEYSLSVFGKVYELMSDRQITQRAELIIGQGKSPSQYGFSELNEMFVEGRGLFYNTTVSSISRLKNSDAETDFGIGVLPIPLYNENQDRYYCAVNRYHSSVVGVPVSNTDNVEAAVFLLNAMGHLNTNLTGGVMAAYYEVTLKLQGTETDEDANMLDIVFDSKFYDLGTVFTFGNLLGLYGSVISNSSDNTLVSKYDAMRSAVEQALEETYTKYLESLF